jgi:capsular polysaccharide biosynthesis protein
LKYYLMGIVGSLALALAYILARSLTDRRIRYASHVTAAVGHPLLAVVGEQPNWRRLGEKLRRNGDS